MKPTFAAPCLALVLGVLGSQRLVRASAFTFENGVYTLYPGNFSFSAVFTMLCASEKLKESCL